MSENERLKKVILWLISQGIIKSQEDLANKFNYNPSSISQIVTGVKPLSQKFINKILNLSEKININYLLGNSNKMLNEYEAINSDNDIIKLILKENKELNQEIGSLKTDNKNLTEKNKTLQTELECRKKEIIELREILDAQYVEIQSLYELPEVPAQLVAEPAAVYGKRKKI